MNELFRLSDLIITGTDVIEPVTLRPLFVSDSESLLRLIRENHLFLRPWLSWAQSEPETIEDVKTFLYACKESESLCLERHFAIEVAGAVRGVMGCGPIDFSNRVVTIGYWIDRDLWGKKIISTALRSLATHLLISGKVHRIEVRCAVENRRGKRAIEYAGFKFEGTLRSAQRIGSIYHDLNIYALIRDDLELVK